ncbi:MAG: 16S rRNA (adenine(1518)-N(6)/adenine(1519)-N(6))-dimethyltransferase RsmA [Firmicutes bacterium]|nr:16S rRNA (adenine(1518)-N(6)/adenine(1519)-N(6))-dimethyltransferase RsmA [Bacillota bacterium]
MQYKKSLGQNFIYDTNLLKSIAIDALICRSVGASNASLKQTAGNCPKAAECHEKRRLTVTTGEDALICPQGDIVVEVGAGLGTLTKVLSEYAEKVISFEIDKDLKEPLLNLNLPNVEFIFEDALKYPLNELHKKINLSTTNHQPLTTNHQNYKLVANLPYYITTPLLFKFLEDEFCTSITIMIQKEVAMRIAAKENTPDYGILSVICQAMSDITYNRTVSRKMFTPSPNVDSAVITLKKNQKPNISDIEYFKRTVRGSFAMRRKTLSNNLIKEFSLSRDEVAAILKKMQKNESIRGETLSVEEFITLSNLIKGYI